MAAQNQPAALRTGPGITIAQLEEICWRGARTAEPATDGYRTTSQQIFFFTLASAVKQENNERRRLKLPTLVVSQRQDGFAYLHEEAAQLLVQVVIASLQTWGPVIGKLQRRPGQPRDEQDWEMLRIQMDKALWCYEYPAVQKEDALYHALLNIMRMVDTLLSPDEIERAADPVAFFHEKQAIACKVYSFDLPFYEYAKRAARNKLLDIQKKGKRDNDLPLDDKTLSGLDRYPMETEEELIRLRLRLTRLFALIKTEMNRQPTRQNVVWQTLVARSQYWLALTMSSLAAPVPLAPLPNAADAEIAQALNTAHPPLALNANTVRVHRRHAQQQIDKVDALAGQLLDTLMDIVLSRKLDDWPAVE